MTTRTQCANAIRALAMDAVQKANSGHPGAPMGMADIAEALWRGVLKHNPADPQWIDRDRFVLSNGHGSMLLYALLHLTGYDLSIDDIRNFRQLGSPTAGHPEVGHAPGIETTTGPLGQGLANAVGMAFAEQLLAKEFNRPGHDVIDHRTWVFLGDGCLMEGISHEVASFAGTHKLGKLIAIYDDNGISIDGPINGWFTDDTAARFEAYGWSVVRDVDGHDSASLDAALTAAQADDKPTLICARTVIGFGSPNKGGKASSHGAALGEDEIALARAQLQWPYEPFEIPAEIAQAWNQREAGAAAQSEWQTRFDAYQGQFPELAAELQRRMRGELPNDFSDVMQARISQAQTDAQSIESRKASGAVLETLADALPELLGGSADLTGSNSTQPGNLPGIAPASGEGRYVYYGVREFGMTAMGNGIALHGGYIPFSGTFLTFMDYARNAVRMAALMGVRNVLVYTHDSVALGEDGPTHQPVEHLASLRTLPNMSTWRPCDVVETAVAWQSAMQRADGPSALILSRQKLPHQNRDASTLANVAKGGYVLVEPEGAAQAVVMATGSEVELAVAAAAQLAGDGVQVRVVSIPSVDVFMAQSDAYRESVLPNSLRARVAVEAAHPDLWRTLVGLDGEVVGISTYGASGPGGAALAHFGFAKDNVVAAVRSVL